MVLKTAKGVEFKAHFSHGMTNGRHARHFTQVTLHTGDCHWFKGGCAATPDVSGRTECSRKDQFVKSIGRRLALTFALAGFGREDRKLMWQEYWKTCRPPKARR